MSVLNTQYNTELDAPRTKKVRVSFDKTGSLTPWSFNVNYGNNPDLDTSKTIELVSCSITHTVPNVSPSQSNNVFALNTSLGLFQITVPTGFYSYSQLGAYITPLLDAFIAPSTSAFTISGAGYAVITVTAGPATISNSALSTLGNALLGFITLNALATHITGDVLPKMQGITYFHIVSNAINSYCITNSITGSNINTCVFSVPVTVPFGFQNVYDNSNNQERISFRSPFSLKNFDIKLFDETGRLLDDMDQRSVVELILKIIY